ncbi:MAG: NADH-quinone oxidoreductase subunit J [Bacillus sp. (in: firmicutes)]
MTLSGEFIAFIVLAVVAIAGGLMLLTLKKVVHMVVAVVFTFISIAGLYILLSAEFVAGVQILIYSGAITIMMLFGIMLTNHHEQEKEKRNPMRKLFVILGIFGFAAVVYFGIYDLDLATQSDSLHAFNTEQIGIALYLKYVIPFEVMSVLLLVALVGAVILAKKDDQEEGEDKP